MKDEKYWDYSDCLIGHPCNKCEYSCSFRLNKNKDKNEKEDDTISDQEP